LRSAYGGEAILFYLFIVEFLKKIFDDCGLDVQRHERVHGGDINHAYCLFTTTGKYFLKLNEKDRYPLMFEREQQGLELLRENCELIIPKVVASGNTGDKQWLLLAWLEKGTSQKNMWENFGEGLARMHKKPGQQFGLNEDNYIGSLKQTNTLHQEWSAFYIECRIMPLVKKLFDEGSYSSKDLNDANSFCNELKNFFPAESPSILHGDLWSGNYMIHSSGYAAIVDPAVYWGHREMDIGMTKLFGGFDDRFYEAYNRTYPLEKGWEARLTVAQLYPLLVHAVLFGGHYVSSTREILHSFG